MSEFDPSKSGAFSLEVEAPGGAKAKAYGKGSLVIMWGSLLAALVWIVVYTWQQSIKLDMIVLVQRETMRHIREIKCLQALPAEDRPNNPGLAAACKAAGDVQ